MKKILSIVLVLLLVVSVMPTGISLTASADSVASGKVGKYTWSVDKETGVLKLTGSGDMVDFDSVDAPWKQYSDYITALELPNTLTKIGDNAFSLLERLKNVTIPDSVTYIGENAFYWCSGLTSVTIGKGVTYIGNYAFYGCSSLTKVNITDLAAWCKINFDCVYYVTHYANPLYYAENLYLNDELITDLVIPDGVTTINERAFIDCDGLTSVTLPKSVTYISQYAFYDCDNLTSVTIPYTAHFISRDSFSSCDNLKKVYIYSKNCDFYECGLNYNQIIYGFKGSTAETLAEEIGAEFIDIMTVHTHTETTIKGKAATCTATGLTEGKKCSVCDTIITAQKVIPAKGHTYPETTIKGKAATCIATGLTEGKTCSVCDTIITAQKTIPAKGHTYKTTTTKATLKKNGSIVKKCTICGEVGSKSIIKYVKTVKLSYASAVVIVDNGRVCGNVVLYVKDSSGKKLKNGTDYTVKGLDKISTQKVGNYKVTVTLKGNYSGKKVLTFKTTPPTTSIKKLTAAKKSLKVKFAKKTKEVTGYEIQYSTSKKFKSAKKVTFKNAKSTGSTNKNLKAKPVRAGTETTSATLKKLKAKKTYYVRIRTYKVVKGKKYYSAWSKALKKKTK